MKVSSRTRVLWAYGAFTLVRQALAPLMAAALWLMLEATSALAVTKYMQGVNGGCSNGSNWSNAACWVGNVAPVTGDDVVMDSTVAGVNGAVPCQTTYDLGSTIQLHSITLNSQSGSCGGNNTSGGPIVLQSGGSITDNFSNSDNDVFPGVTLNGPATFSLTAATDSLHFAGAITGTGPLTLTNTGLADGLQLTVASSYTGATTVSGTARVDANVNGAIPTGSAVTVNTGAKLKFSASSTIGSLAGGGNVFMNGSNTLTVGGDNTSTTFSGVYQNSGGSAALTKTGTGTLTLSGANTYTGATTVNAGTLAVTGSLASPVTVNSGGTLAGTGTISNTVTVNSGGTLSPGTSPGILTTDDLALNSGSTLTIELKGTTVGSDYDQVNVTGTVTVLDATLHVVLGFTPSAGQVFTIISNDGTDPVVGAFAGLAEGATLSLGGNTFRISYEGGSGNDVTLTALVVTPFATFTVQQLDLTIPPRINDAFALHARFTLGAGSDGIAPWADQVALTLTSGAGAFTTTIPAGAFQVHRPGPFTFTGLIHGVQLDAALTPLCPTLLGCRVYTFAIAGDHADLTGLANPVTVTLTIGNDSGRTTVQAHIKH